MMLPAKMKTFKQYFEEAIITNDRTSTKLSYNLRSKPFQHYYIHTVKTPEEYKNKGGATELVDKLKQQNLPIMLDPIGPKARIFFTKRGFKPYNKKYMIWYPVSNI